MQRYSPLMARMGESKKMERSNPIHSRLNIRDVKVPRKGKTVSRIEGGHIPGASCRSTREIRDLTPPVMMVMTLTLVNRRLEQSLTLCCFWLSKSREKMMANPNGANSIRRLSEYAWRAALLAL